MHEASCRKNGTYYKKLHHEPKADICSCCILHDIDFFRKMDCNLIVRGHAHGQSLPAKYTTGVYEHSDEKDLVISRSLAKSYRWIPGLYNNPGIVVIDLSGKKE